MTNDGESEWLERFKPAIEIMRKAQRIYPDGDDLEPVRLSHELREAIEAAGLVEGDEDEEYFRLLSGSSPRNHRRHNNLDIDDPPPREQRGRLLTQLRRMASAKRPLKSAHCRGPAFSRVNQALRRHEKVWLGEKGINNRLDVVSLLNKKKLRITDHDRIRDLITEHVIPEEIERTRVAAEKLKAMPPVSNASKPWKQTVVLELANLFARYAPPKGYLVDGIAALSVNANSHFIGFLSNALEPFLRPNEVGAAALATYWRERRNIMKTIR